MTAFFRHRGSLRLRRLPIVALAILCIVWHPAIRAQGELQAMRDEVRIADPPAPKSDRDDWFGAGYIVWISLTFLFWGPKFLLEDDGSPGYYPRYPYEQGLPGYLMIEPEFPVDAYAWSTRVRADWADNFDDVARGGGRVLYETTSRFGADGEANYRTERLVTGGHDSLWTGDSNLVYRFAQSEHWQFRAGGGVNWLADPIGTDWGFNLTYQVDWLPRDPWVLGFEMDWGRVGHANLVHVRSTIGCQYRGVEVYTGYDYFELGSSLSGIIGGVQFWF